ncbi:hypothetical protein, partial [Escherichia coli]|uniref:hypothetical protein n=1 Tax=Escherichia coli TaxID=562 RepID=UPI001BDC3756
MLAPTFRMLIAYQLIYCFSGYQYFHVITLMTLVWRDVFDPAVLMFKVLPVYKTVYPYSGIINSAET